MNVGYPWRSSLVLCSLLSLVNVGAIPAPSPSSTISLDVPGRADADPWVAASGSFVAVTWGATVGGSTDVFMAVSRDGGSTFGSPVRVNSVAGEARLGGEFPPRVALVQPSPPINVRSRRAPTPEIAVLWTAGGDATDVKVARSRDGGRTFEKPVTLQSRKAAGNRGWPAVALDQRANVHAIWLDHRGMAAKRTAGAGHAGHQPGAVHDGVAMAQKSGLYYASMTTAVSRERELAKGVCYCCKTAVAAGPNGSLYAAWRHVYPGNLRDMAFTMSRDGGRTFASPIRVSEDGWAINGCPDDGPAIALGAAGEVHMAWPSVITGTKPEGAIFYASTRDGRRFSPRVRIPTLGGPRPTHPQIVVDRGGRIFVAWEENINGRRLSAVREVRLPAGGAPAFGDVVMLSPNGPAMYPVLAATDKGLVAVWTAGGEPSRVEVRTLSMP
jgi:hypothetical protein